MPPAAIVSGRLSDKGPVRWVQGHSHSNKEVSGRVRLLTWGYSGVGTQDAMPGLHISWPTRERSGYAAEDVMTANRWSALDIQPDEHTNPVGSADTTAQFWPATTEQLGTQSNLDDDDVMVFMPGVDIMAMMHKVVATDWVNSWLADPELLGDSQLQPNPFLLTEGLSTLGPSVGTICRAWLDRADLPSRIGYPSPPPQYRPGGLSTVMGSYRRGVGHNLAGAPTRTFMSYQHADTEEQPAGLQTLPSQDRSGESTTVMESIRNRLRHKLAGAKICIFFSRHPADLEELPALHEWATHMPAQQVQLVDNPERDRLLAKLMASFEEDPFEDGMDHPSEDIIAESLGTKKEQTVLGWLADFCKDKDHPAFSASLLRCLGRHEHAGTDSWRKELVRDGLSTEDVEIRDAAVQAAESWGDSGLVEILEAHSEREPWLQQYIIDVIGDLKE